MIHSDAVVLSQSSGITEETVLGVVEVLYNSRVAEDGQTLPSVGRDSGLHRFHITICELTSPISNRQHRQLKMETYLDIGNGGGGGNPRVTGVDRGGSGVDRRHC
jgi:hypothetical protein